MTCYSIARVSEPSKSIPLLNRGITLARIILEEESSNARRPRDLALMLSLRGTILVENEIDVQGGIQDFEEVVALLTRRALESPREAVTQEDFQEHVYAIALLLNERGQSNAATEICNGAIDQLECVANAGALAGGDDWLNILEGLRNKMLSVE